MRCAILDEPDKPLRLTVLPVPDPGPDEVLVRVEACGVCHSDLHIASGEWTESLERRVRPTILGHEIVGRIVEAGASVRELEAGQRVGVGWVGETCGRCEHCEAGDDNLCVERRVTCVDRQGGWSTHALLHASQAVVVPEALDPVEAAPLFCAGVTVFRGMKKAGIRPGQRVAVFGAGGLGHIGVQLARAWGAETIAVDPGDAQRALALELGASQALSPDGAVGEILSGGGAHVAVVTAPAVRAYRQAARSLRKGGTLVVVGLPSEPLQFVADHIATAEIRIVGSAVGSKADQGEILSLAAEGKIRCMTERVTLDEIDGALARLREGSVRGRIVVVP